MKNRLSRLGRSRKSLPDVHQFCSLAQILDSTLINRFVYLVTILIDQLCCLILIQGCDFNLNIVSIRVFVLYVLRRTKTLELTVNHYTNLRAQSFSFFHAMSCENYCREFPQSANIRNHCPHKTFSLRIHSSRWFVEKNDGWIADESYCTLQLSFVSPTQCASMNVLICNQIKFLNLSHHKFFLVV